MKRSAIHLSPNSSPHPPLSLSSITYPQPSMNPLPSTHMSPYANGHMSGFVRYRSGPSTSAASSAPPAKRRRTEPPPFENIVYPMRYLDSHPPSRSSRPRHGRRGIRNPEKKASNLRKYVDSGGPHRATMVIDDLTGKYYLTHLSCCSPNTLCQKSTTPLITPMSASTSSAMARKSAKLSGMNTPMLVTQKTSLPFRQLPTGF